MNKKIFVLIAILSIVILVTGCKSNTIVSNEKTMVCTKENIDNDGYVTNEIIEITYNPAKVLKVNQSSIIETNPTYIDFTIGFMSGFKSAFDNIDGIKFDINKVDNNKIKTVVEIEYEKIDFNKLKEALNGLSTDNNALYSNTNYTIDQFKENILKDYTCK